MSTFKTVNRNASTVRKKIVGLLESEHDDVERLADDIRELVLEDYHSRKFYVVIYGEHGRHKGAGPLPTTKAADKIAGVFLHAGFDEVAVVPVTCKMPDEEYRQEYDWGYLDEAA